MSRYHFRLPEKAWLPSTNRLVQHRTSRALLAAGAAMALVAAAPAAGASAHTRGDHEHAGTAVQQVNLVSDQPGAAAITDPDLVNPWGLAAGPATPVWVADNHSDRATIYRGAIPGQPITKAPLVVSIPEGAPTGQVFNDTDGFTLADGKPALFIFDSESGHVTAWNGASGTTAELVASSKDGAIYKGLALVHRSHGSARLLAADFHNGKIDVFNSAFRPVRMSKHAFRDPFLPKGYAPFNVAEIRGRVVVTYALQDANAEDDTSGTGHGFIDVYSQAGTLLRHFARRGVLNSPWGLTIAPQGFGPLSGTLLVGNFGDGRIHAFNLMSGRVVATLRGGDGKPIAIDGLWALMPGNGITGQPSDVLFSAGPAEEEHGLFGLLRLATAD